MLSGYLFGILLPTLFALIQNQSTVQETISVTVLPTSCLFLIVPILWTILFQRKLYVHEDGSVSVAMLFHQYRDIEKVEGITKDHPMFVACWCRGDVNNIAMDNEHLVLISLKEGYGKHLLLSPIDDRVFLQVLKEQLKQRMQEEMQGQEEASSMV